MHKPELNAPVIAQLPDLGENIAHQIVPLCLRVCSMKNIVQHDKVTLGKKLTNLSFQRKNIVQHDKVTLGKTNKFKFSEQKSKFSKPNKSFRLWKNNM